ncbi:MAG: hypothetical protein NVS2B9_00130 [Myxococcales bacterium]
MRSFDRVPELGSRLGAALDDVPATDRALIEAVLAARGGDPVLLAASWTDPRAMLRALRYLDAGRDALPRLRAACVLAERLQAADERSLDPASLAHAVNLGATPAAESALRALPDAEKSRLAAAVNLLFAGPETHLALCAMRTVGDLRSLALIEQSVGDRREGISVHSDGRREPSWESVRREARDAIRRRLRGP